MKYFVYKNFLKKALQNFDWPFCTIKNPNKTSTNQNKPKNYKNKFANCLLTKQFKRWRAIIEVVACARGDALCTVSVAEDQSHRQVALGASSPASTQRANVRRLIVVSDRALVESRSHVASHLGLTLSRAPHLGHVALQPWSTWRPIKLSTTRTTRTSRYDLKPKHSPYQISSPLLVVSSTFPRCKNCFHQVLNNSNQTNKMGQKRDLRYLPETGIAILG